MALSEDARPSADEETAIVPAWNRFSETEGDLRGELDREILQMKIKVIMGAASLEDWDRFVEQLQQDERYLSVMRELNEY